jgi:predicted nucleotidyltransferase component of viral defense system
VEVIDLIKSKLNFIIDKQEKFNFLREYLQLIILSIIDELGYFKNLAFVGGTALRIIYKTNRYSEDLDFTLVKKDGYEFDKLTNSLLRELVLRGFNVDFKLNKQKTSVHSIFIKFNDILYQTNLSSLASQKITIKFEIDTSPPLGFNTIYSSFIDPFVFGINHFDKSSLMSGKLNAIFTRKYQKGRDYYDLLWYLINGIEPNSNLLHASLKQSNNHNAKNWKQELTEKLNNTNFKKIQEDLLPFLIFKNEVMSINKEQFSKLL